MRLNPHHPKPIALQQGVTVLIPLGSQCFCYICDMQLSVIILNYNVRYFLEQCVLSVEKAIANLDAEIIVVDNNSSDDSCEMIRSRFPNVKLIANTANTGFPKGNNIGVAEASGEFICILNPDTVVAEDTFDKVLAFAKAKIDIGIVGVKLIDGTGKFLPESKRGIPTPFVAITKISGLYKISKKLFGKYYASHLSEDETGKVEILVGAFMLLRREVYLEVGGFDENCFMYSDDIDLSYTILKTGRSNYYFSQTTVIHYKGESTVKDEMYMKRFSEAMRFFYQKHFRLSRSFDICMKFGTAFFSAYKARQSGVTKPAAEKYIMLSDDRKLYEKVENLLGKKVELLETTTENNLYSFLNGNRRTEVIFDSSQISYQSIITMMEKHRSDHTTYKIIPIGNNFMIGSNSSNDRGEIIHLI
jgi:GT2 family glycosyltransferase